MKWLAVGIWIVFCYGVLYWIEIKMNVVYTPEPIMISEVNYEQNETRNSEYSGITEVVKD